MLVYTLVCILYEAARAKLNPPVAGSFILGMNAEDPDRQERGQAKERLPGTQQSEPPRVGTAGGAAAAFIGRNPELQALRAALEGAEAGTDQLVMLAGDAGMGKTRLCQEVAAEAARRGIPTIWGRCFEEPGAPPYWPWIQAIRTAASHWNDTRLRALLGDDAAPIAGIVPEVRNRLGDLPPVSALAADQLRFQLFQAITQLWQRIAAERSLVLILDNLHWADPTSLRLLSFLAADLGAHRLMLLCTYRQTELSRGCKTGTDLFLGLKTGTDLFSKGSGRDCAGRTAVGARSVGTVQGRLRPGPGGPAGLQGAHCSPPRYHIGRYAGAAPRGWPPPSAPRRDNRFSCYPHGGRRIASLRRSRR